MSGLEICQFFKKCPLSTTTTIAKTDAKIYRGPQAVPPVGPQWNKEDMFKIVHFTDVHIDPKYVKVSGAGQYCRCVPVSSIFTVCISSIATDVHT